MISTKTTIAVLLTCFNRKDLTLACLDDLFQCSGLDYISLKIHLVDDGSTDGTAQAIKEHYPEINIIKGNGQLYWNGGMQLAWETALKDPADFYLWLNDDVSLKTDAIEVLIKTHAATRTSTNESVITGTLSDLNTGKLSYGGYKIEKGLFHFRGVKLPVSDNPTECDTLNGNIVLVPQSVVDKVGILDKKFTHAMGDFDYGLRCKKAGVPMFTTPNFIASCSNNSLDNTWSDPTLSLPQRWTKVRKPTGLPPMEYFYYNKKHSGGFTATVMLGKLLLRIIFPSVWKK